MKNLILQHFTGNLGYVEKESTKNIQEYAKKINVNYQLLLGNVFHKNFRPCMQKIHMLSEEFDEYDNVLMLDIDMFVSRNFSENVFDFEGIGVYNKAQERLLSQIVKKYPKLANLNYPYWGGEFYKLSSSDRKKLREGIGDKSWMEIFNKPGHFGDEGIMHCLSVKTDFLPKTLYLKENFVLGSNNSKVQEAKFIHVRPLKKGRSKNEVLNNLKKKQII